jgi:hypothetical protein
MAQEDGAVGEAAHVGEVEPGPERRGRQPGAADADRPVGAGLERPDGVRSRSLTKAGTSGSGAAQSKEPVASSV